MTIAGPRRVVAALDERGRSAIVSDAPAATLDLGTMRISQLWTGDLAAKVRSASSLEAATGPFRFEQLAEPVYAMMLAEYAPGQGADDPGMHSTDTADHFYVIAGEVVLVLETGEATLRAGDVGVIRGVVHGWRNDGAVPARLVTFVLPATPAVGA